LTLPLLLVALVCTYVLWRYTRFVVRIFEERPLFIVPRAQPLAGAEEVRFATSDGLTLAGSYLRTPRQGRKGVILFGPEFGASRWSCTAYCRHLLEAGFDVFSFDFRNQGESDALPGYQPMQWVTNHEVEDMRSAIRYLRSRADADPAGIGFFGISRGGGAGILAAATEPYVRCLVTDGAFATITTMLPYMRKWASLYLTWRRLEGLIPRWLYLLVAYYALGHVSRRRRCWFPSMERAMARLSPRPLLMIHGGNDTYIKPEIAQALFRLARQPKELWLVPQAKHNQAIYLAADEYRQRVLGFFQRHLSGAGTEASRRTGTPACVAGTTTG
jgi:pimeloyl-ACP methyl ester carboxylesterase